MSTNVPTPLQTNLSQAIRQPSLSSSGASSSASSGPAPQSNSASRSGHSYRLPLGASSPINIPVNRALRPAPPLPVRSASRTSLGNVYATRRLDSAPFPSSISAAASHSPQSLLPPAAHVIRLSSQLLERERMEPEQKRDETPIQHLIPHPRQSVSLNQAQQTFLAQNVKGAIQRHKDLTRQYLIQTVLDQLKNLASEIELNVILATLAPACKSTSCQASSSSSEPFQQIARFIDRLSSPQLWTAYIVALEQVPAYQRPVLCGKLILLFEGIAFEKGTDYQETLNAWCDTPAEQKEHLLDLVENDLKGISSDNLRGVIVRSINLLPPKSNSNLKYLVINLFKYNSIQDDVNKIYSSLCLLPRQDVAYVIACMVPIMSHSHDYPQRVMLFQKIVTISLIHKLHLDIITSALIWIGLTTPSIYHKLKMNAFLDKVLAIKDPNKIADAFHDINPNELNHVKLIASRLSMLNHQWQQKLLLTITLNLPKPSIRDINQLIEFISLYDQVNEPVLNGGRASDMIELIKETIMVIPPEHRLKAINTWANLKKEGNPCKLNIVTKLFISDPQLMKLSIEYLTDVFENTGDRKKAFKLADFTTIVFLGLQVPYNSDVEKILDLALTIKENAEEDNMSQKNPYVIFDQLQKKSVLTILDEAIMLGQYEDTDYELNLEGFQARADKVTYTIGDLPAGISHQTFKQLFLAISTRLQALPVGNRTACEMIIKRKFRNGFTSFSALEDKVLGCNKKIPILLNVKGSKDAKISESSFYLYADLNYIMGLNNDVVDPACLTARENAFIDLCSRIWECNSGQEDGVSDYFITLPAIHRRSAKANPEAGSVKKVESSIEIEMQKELLELFQNEQMHAKIRKLKPVLSAIKESAESELDLDLEVDAEMESSEKKEEEIDLVEDKQYSHFIISLKNNFFKEIGLIHTLKLDFGTETLSDDYVKLLNTNPKEILKIIASHVTLENLVNCVKRSVQHSLDTKNLTYSILESYFDENYHKIPSEEVDIQKLLVFDESLNTTGISDLGALSILNAMGYIKTVSKVAEDEDDASEVEDSEVEDSEVKDSEEEGEVAQAKDSEIEEEIEESGEVQEEEDGAYFELDFSEEESDVEIDSY